MTPFNQVWSKSAIVLYSSLIVWQQYGILNGSEKLFPKVVVLDMRDAS